MAYIHPNLKKGSIWGVTIYESLQNPWVESFISGLIGMGGRERSVSDWRYDATRATILRQTAPRVATDPTCISLFNIFKIFCNLPYPFLLTIILTKIWNNCKQKRGELWIWEKKHWATDITENMGKVQNLVDFYRRISFNLY